MAQFQPVNKPSIAAQKPQRRGGEHIGRISTSRRVAHKRWHSETSSESTTPDSESSFQSSFSSASSLPSLSIDTSNLVAATDFTAIPSPPFSCARFDQRPNTANSFIMNSDQEDETSLSTDRPTLPIEALFSSSPAPEEPDDVSEPTFCDLRNTLSIGTLLNPKPSVSFPSPESEPELESVPVSAPAPHPEPADLEPPRKRVKYIKKSQNSNSSNLSNAKDTAPAPCSSPAPDSSSATVWPVQAILSENNDAGTYLVDWVPTRFKTAAKARKAVTANGGLKTGKMRRDDSQPKMGYLVEWVPSEVPMIDVGTPLIMDWIRQRDS